MSGKKADKSRYWLTYLIENLPIGATFKPSVLHLTIVPWFVTEIDEQEVVDSFYKQFSKQEVLRLNIGEEGEFDHKRKIPINFINQKTDLTVLHKKALEWLESLDARWAVKAPHVGRDYIPHIRRRPGRNVAAGEQIDITSLSLVRAHRRGDDFRIVIAKVEFNEKAQT